MLTPFKAYSEVAFVNEMKNKILQQIWIEDWGLITFSLKIKMAFIIETVLKFPWPGQCCGDRAGVKPQGAVSWRSKQEQWSVHDEHHQDPDLSRVSKYT